MKSKALKLRRVETLREELDRVQHRITERAYEIFRTRGGRLGAALDDWLTAERQTVWKPAIEVWQKDETVVVEAAVAGVEAGDLNLEVTADRVLITAEIAHAHGADKGTVHVCEFQPGHLFRLIDLPAPIDPDGVKAEYRNGLLRLTAPIAVARPARTVAVTAA